MKEVTVVHKTHLDLGFTDFAENVRQRYLKEFIPKAIRVATQLNSGGEKRFVWTTGSWLIKEALSSGNRELRESTMRALKNGDIAAHALPFTTHTELLDKATFEYGLSLIDEIDAVTGVKTIAAKMTDVPGHTAAIVPILAAHGIKLLHIGINTAAAFPKVPECFLWKYAGAEIVVIYSNGYGGKFECPFTDKVLYFEHASDNGGVKSAAAIARRFEQIKREYPGCRVRAGRIDDVAEALWNIRHKLPVVQSEIGDTWIHGIGSDPYKTAAVRTLMKLQADWIGRGEIKAGSDCHKLVSDALLCCAEHTWGGDMKMFLQDTEHYRKDKFVKARARDKVVFRNLFGDFPFRIYGFLQSVFKIRPRSYSYIEKSWKEQRGYIDKALNALPPQCRQEAEAALAALRPAKLPPLPNTEKYSFGSPVSAGNAVLSVNEQGTAMLTIGENTILDAQDRPLLTYISYGKADLDRYAEHYLRHREPWAVSDNLRPTMKKDDCASGSFSYRVKSGGMRKNGSCTEIHLLLTCDAGADTGAPRNAYAKYVLSGQGLTLELFLTDKDAVRTPESISCLFYPVYTNAAYIKTGTKIDPTDVVSHGNRKLSAVERAVFALGARSYAIESVQAALVASDGGNILHFDDAPADIAANGLAFVLHNNIWGTNFPLWYEENSYFKFSLTIR